MGKLEKEGPAKKNETTLDIYEGYCEEMKRMLDMEESSPKKFTNVEFAEYFEQKVERLDTLIGIYGDLMLAMRNWN
jgi:hypothetical protein